MRDVFIVVLHHRSGGYQLHATPPLPGNSRCLPVNRWWAGITPNYGFGKLAE